MRQRVHSGLASRPSSKTHVGINLHRDINYIYKAICFQKTTPYCRFNLGAIRWLSLKYICALLKAELLYTFIREEGLYHMCENNNSVSKCLDTCDVF